MIQRTLFRKLALGGALVASLALAGATMAATPNSHASSTAVSAVSSNAPDVSAGADAAAVSAAAASDITGGAHNNHGGYVSCVARGGSNCNTTTPTLPSHGDASDHKPASVPSH